MNVSALYPADNARGYAGGWTFSLVFHTAVIAVAMLALSDLRLAPQPEPFHWNVALVQPPSPAVVQPAPSPAPAPRPQKRKTEPEPVRPVTEPIPVERVVRQETREVREVRAITKQPALTHRVSRTVENPIEAFPTAAVPTAQPVEPNVATRDSEAVRPVPAQQPIQAAQPVQSVTAPAEPRSDTVETAQPVQTDQDVREVAPAQTAMVRTPEIVRQPTSSFEAPAVHEVPVRQMPATKADYGWLVQTLRERVEQLKRYPHTARMNRWEGKVVLRAVIRDDGEIENLEVAESSGYRVLDKDAMDIIKLAAPLPLKHPLGQRHVVVQIPISYHLQ